MVTGHRFEFWIPISRPFRLVGTIATSTRGAVPSSSSGQSGALAVNSSHRAVCHSESPYVLLDSRVRESFSLTGEPWFHEAMPLPSWLEPPSPLAKF